MVEEKNPGFLISTFVKVPEEDTENAHAFIAELKAKCEGLTHLEFDVMQFADFAGVPGNPLEISEARSEQLKALYLSLHKARRKTLAGLSRGLAPQAGLVGLEWMNLSASDVKTLIEIANTLNGGIA